MAENWTTISRLVDSRGWLSVLGALGPTAGLAQGLGQRLGIDNRLLPAGRRRCGVGVVAGIGIGIAFIGAVGVGIAFIGVLVTAALFLVPLSGLVFG
jgi:hypothetical protein